MSKQLATLLARLADAEWRVKQQQQHIAELISACEELTAVLISQDFTILNLFEDGDLGQFEGGPELRRAQAVIAKARKGACNENQAIIPSN